MDALDALEYLWSHPTWRASLGRYRRWFRRIERPSAAQIDNFVDHVAEAHSWYKHLPLFHQGHRFTFYLDPAAGTAQRDLPFGFCSTRDARAADVWHYSQTTTADYRARFGCLAFQERPLPAAPPLVSRRGRRVRIPVQIEAAGSLLLNGTIHSNATYWMLVCGGENERNMGRDGDPIHWPESCGGPAAIAPLLAELEEHAALAQRFAMHTEVDLEDPDARAFTDLRERLDAAITAARAAQRASARAAIDATLDLVYE